MNVLIDHHHGALFRSLHYLFHNRLGYNVYVPYGIEWHDEMGLYSCYKNKDVARQMLYTWTDEEIYQKHYNFIPLTYDEYISTRIDLYVASLYENYSVFENCNVVFGDTDSKVIFQAGNNTPIVFCNEVDNFMSSSYPSYKECDVANKVFYRQEFNLDFFKPTKPEKIRSIGCFKNYMDQVDLPLWGKLKELMPDWEFKAYGHSNDDGTIDDKEHLMAEIMGKFGFIFHVKHDDGYGHVIHNAFALGKPMIVNMEASYKTVGYDDNVRVRNTSTFLFEKDTSYDYFRPNYQDNMEDFVLDSSSDPEYIAKRLNEIADDYDNYSQRVTEKFNKIVNFENDALLVKEFLNKLI